MRLYRSGYVLGGWRSPEAPRKLVRRGYRDRTSERGRDLVGARAVWEAKRNEKTGFGTVLYFF